MTDRVDRLDCSQAGPSRLWAGAVAAPMGRPCLTPVRRRRHTKPASLGMAFNGSPPDPQGAFRKRNSYPGALLHRELFRVQLLIGEIPMSFCTSKFNLP